jgi:hypothetical protein
MKKAQAHGLCLGFLLYTSSIAHLIGVYRRAKEEYFEFGMSGLREKRRFGGLDKKTAAEGRPSFGGFSPSDITKLSPNHPPTVITDKSLPDGGR